MDEQQPKRPRGNPNIRDIGHATRFPPGHTPKMGGRRPRLSITRLVRDELEKPAVEGSKVSNAEMVAARIVNMAKAGDSSTVRLVWAYVDGEPRQATEMTLRELAEQLAAKMNLDAQELLKMLERELGAA